MISKNTYFSTLLLALILLCLEKKMQGQNVNITVKDQATKEVLPSVSIQVKNLSNSKSSVILGITDNKGLFQKQVTFPAIIFYSSLGYQTISDTLYEPTTKIVLLKEIHRDLNPISVTAEYTASKVKNSIYDIQVIDRAKIDQKGANNLRELLMTELGTSISQDNILGTSVSQQGLGGENIKILIDGVPVIGRLNGSIDLSQINLSNVEKVEIIEGPLSALYGSNALGGVINVITKTKQDERIQASIHGYYEHVGQFNADANIGIKVKDHLFQMSGGRYFFDGFSYPDSNRSKQWKPKEQYFGSASYAFNKKAFNCKIKADIYHELITDRGNLRKPYYIDAFDDYYRTKRYDISTDVSYKFKQSKSITVKGAYSYYNRRKNNYFKDLTTLENILTAPDNQDTSVFTNIMTRAIYSFYAPEKKLTYQMGIDINYETGSGIRIINHSQNMGDYALFASLEYRPVASFVMKPAVRISYNSRFNSPIIPSLNIKYKPLTNLTFRASYSRGFRAPSLKELYFYFVDINHNIIGNEKLIAETSHNIQFSVNYVKQLKKTTIDAEGNFFYNDVHNLIRLASVDANQFTYINVANSRTLGGAIETSIIYEQFRAKAGMQVTGIYSDFGKGVKTNGFETTPAISLDMSYRWSKVKMEFSLFYKYVGKQPGVYVANATDLKTFYTRSYHLLDLTCAKYLFKNLIKLSIGGKNLLNVKNIQATGNYVSNGVHGSATNTLPVGWGTSFFADLKINLNGSNFRKKSMTTEDEK